MTGPALGGLAVLGVFLSWVLVPAVVGVWLVARLPQGLRLLAAPERARLRALLRADTPPTAPRPVHVAGLQGLAATATDGTAWREAGWLAGQVVLGPLAFVLVAVLWGLPLFLLTLPTWTWAVDRLPLGLLTVTSRSDALLVALLGLVLLPVAALLVRLLGAQVAAAAQRWLGPDVHAQLAAATARAQELERTRTIAVSAAAGERRRLERDLHDGAQSRLVSLAVTLALAEESIERDPDGSRALMREARTEAVTAVEELRDLSRGLAPTVLRTRGLVAALEALTGAQPVPTSFDARGYAERAPDEVESALWFAAAEALANAGKHAGAASVAVRLASYPDGWLLEVADDGRGGAVEQPGGGLAGLQDRLAPLDGWVEVSSAPGRGTTVAVRVPVGA